MLTNWLSDYIVEFRTQEKLWSVTRVVWRKCTLSIVDKLKCSIKKMTSLEKKSLFSIFQNMPTLVTIRSYTTWRVISNSELWSQNLPKKMRIFQWHLNLPFISCVLKRKDYFISAMFSPKLLRTSKEGLKKEDLDSCNREIPILKNGRSNSKKLRKIKEQWSKEIMKVPSLATMRIKMTAHLL